MFLFLNTAEKLFKFIIKALSKAIKAGNKIISLYNNAEKEISDLKKIIDKLEEIKVQIETKTTDGVE